MRMRSARALTVDGVAGTSALHKAAMYDQGEVVYKPMQPGEAYELRVESSGGMTLVPLGRYADAGNLSEP